MGLPCITTDVGDAALLLGETGIVVAKENPAELAAALEKFINLDESQRRAQGTLSNNRIKSEFSMSSCVDSFSRVYNDIYHTGQSSENSRKASINKKNHPNIHEHHTINDLNMSEARAQ